MEAISQQDLEQVAFIFDQVKNYLRGKEVGTSKALSDDLETMVTETMSEISTKICEDLSPTVLEFNILNSRYQLFKFCADKISASQDDEGCSIWNQIFFQIEKVYQQVFSMGLRMATTQEITEKALAKQKRETDEILQAAEELEKTANVNTI